MSATDPLQTVWDALERRGCFPHGQPYNFPRTARFTAARTRMPFTLQSAPTAARS